MKIRAGEPQKKSMTKAMPLYLSVDGSQNGVHLS